jgi:hypothetical protein
MKLAFLIISTVLTMYSVVPYMRDILKGKTRPNIVTWMTWSLLTGIATAAEIAGHEYFTAVFTGAAAVETAAVVFLGLRHGYVKYTRFDTTCQIAAVVGIILWQLFNSPAIGVVAAVAIDFVGALPTIRHAWLAPGEETWQAFAISGVGSLFAIASFSHYNWISLPYAIYIILANTLLSVIIVGRRSAMIKP